MFVGLGMFKSSDPVKWARAIVQAVTHSRDSDVLAEVSYRLGEVMVGFKRLFGWISGFKGLFGWIVDVMFLVSVDMGKRGRQWGGEGRLFFWGGQGGDIGG
ncbi:pyridoxal biosynthesis protein PDX1.3 [Pyrus ussuriensis x Pyrus communis]|uniref:Pyridoxal biosynthesis protein PDX1.3 n=1 Tax=Pyrus ussuriensis x Pyrus communis TaxID=2448454 RepID=A0A5N5GU73_9ROSA|nr:pyridoxal biosynthesis protein PDX1.3 [Pyrus ussuriensis x Pyrus communis]